MKTSFTGLVFVQRLLLVGGLSVGITLSDALSQAQDPPASEILDASPVQSPGNLHAEEERTLYGQLLPLYDLLSAGSRRANAQALSAIVEDEVSSTANEAASPKPESTSPNEPPSATTRTSTESTSTPEVEKMVASIAPDAQPLALLIGGEQKRESSGADEADHSKRAYVLMFDPDDPRSQLAYQMAQAMAQTNQLLDEELQTSQPESEAAAEVLTNPPPIERVKLTGRLLRNVGIEAIAVTHVERAAKLEPLAPLLEERQKKASTHQPPAPQR
jgi:hypothetical protein